MKLNGQTLTAFVEALRRDADSLLERGLSFSVILMREDGESLREAIGTGTTRCLMCLDALWDLYAAAGDGTPEQYIDSVRDAFLQYAAEREEAGDLG